MPIISPIEAKSVRGRLTLGLIIALLALGGVTMVYPFAIMVSGALRSEMDEADLDLVLLNWGADVAGLPPEWINERPATDIVGQAALDRVLLNWGAAALEGQVLPGRESLSGRESPRDERVGGQDTADRDLAFATFAAAETNTPLRHGLLAALVTGRLTL